MENMFKLLSDFYNPNLTLKDDYKNLSKEELEFIIKIHIDSNSQK